MSGRVILLKYTSNAGSRQSAVGMINTYNSLLLENAWHTQNSHIHRHIHKHILFQDNELRSKMLDKSFNLKEKKRITGETLEY